MADPFTIALITGGGLTAFGAIKEGQIADVRGRFAKKIARRNQLSLERQAKAEKEAAAVEETRVARRQKIVQARQIARIGKQATGLAGATLAALSDTAFQFSMERNLTLRRGFIRARELKERGRIVMAQGRWARTLGAQAKRLSYVKASASILGAIGTAGLLSKAGTVGTTTGTVGAAPFTPSTFPGVGLIPPV